MMVAAIAANSPKRTPQNTRFYSCARQAGQNNVYLAAALRAHSSPPVH
jgi:hypothetical protein